jgi:hypothetical protein
VYITRRDQRAEDEGVDFVHYGPSGARLGIEAVGVDRIKQQWYAQPGSTNRWILGLDRIYLVDAQGHTVRAIERDANGRWLVYPDAAATAPDGSIAVVSNQPFFLAVQPSAVTVFSRGGDPLQTWPYPGRPYLASVAYDGETIALLTDEPDSKQRPDVTLLDTRTGATRTFAPPSATVDSSIFIVTRNGADELWVFDGGAKIERYALR